MEVDETVFFGKLQNLKIEMVQMINAGQSPYAIITAIAKQLEALSGESGYAAEVEGCLTAVYGIGLQQEVPLATLLEQAESRAEKLACAEKEPQLPPNVRKRLHFAWEQHQSYITFLQEQLKKQ